MEDETLLSDNTVDMQNYYSLLRNNHCFTPYLLTFLSLATVLFLDKQKTYIFPTKSITNSDNSCKSKGLSFGVGV